MNAIQEKIMHPAGVGRHRFDESNAGPIIGSMKSTSANVSVALMLIMFSAATVILTAPARGQSVEVLYNFAGGSDGSQPMSRLTADGKGNYYGTTSNGKGPQCALSGCGTVFELSPNGTGGWNETVLYDFTGTTDPTSSPVTLDGAGNLYGTEGGQYGNVFELSPSGSGWTHKVLYSFFLGGTDGAGPVGGVIMDHAGNIYGTTYVDNARIGTVFELSPSGGTWTKREIYVDKIKSIAGLTMDSEGNIFFTDSAAVFELSPNNSGGWNANVIHTFTRDPPGGLNAQGTLVLDQAGNVYGTTTNGGVGPGTVFELSPGADGWTENVLYSFKGIGKSDGANPHAGIVFDEAGNIYGTTLFGGKDNVGIVFELVAPTSPGGGYSERILWNFDGASGANPFSSLVVDKAGHLYGTASYGGTGCSPGGCGVVYEVTPAETTATTLTSSLNPSTHGEAVTFTAVVTSGGGTPPDGETVSFKRGLMLLGTGTLSGGSASYSTSTLKVNTFAISAVYGGDSLFYGSTSNTVEQVVKAPVK
jgi:uncharacterized repeat protein (TIGR03803 family)